MRKAQLLVLALLLILLLVACAPKSAPAPSPPALALAKSAPAPVPAVPATPAKPKWQQQWETVLEAARQEGELTFATSAGSEARASLSKAFKSKYGIRVESIMGTGPVLSPKMLAERRAGLYLWDIVLTGPSALITAFKPTGLTSPLEPALVLPDLTDPEVIKTVWYGGKLPWLDRDRHLLGAHLYTFIAMAINTNLVKPGEINSWNDLLNPKWKGKILLVNPTMPGTTSDGMLMLMLYEVKGEDWVRKLAVQEPVIVADDRLATDWLAHGKYPILLPPRTNTLTELIQAGAPVAKAETEESAALVSGASVASLIDKAPHPNAAKLFINWYLSQEGQTIMSKSRQAQSARLDVPTDFLPTQDIRKPGVNYWVKDREEVLAKQTDYRAKSKEIFGHLIK